MKTSIPQLDPNKAARKEAIAQEKIRYQFDFSFHNIGFPKHVPKEDEAEAVFVGGGQ